MEVVITGIGLVSALGSLAVTWQQVLAGQSGVQLRQPFRQIAPCPLAMVGKTPARGLDLTQQVVAAALQDARLTAPQPDCGVVIGSSRSQQARWEAMAQQQVLEPGRGFVAGWLEALPHQLAIATARQIGSTGPVLAPMAACATGLWAMAQAYDLLQTGQCQRVIAGAIEAPITPLTLAGFRQMGALATEGAYPFDRRRQGLALGEGGAVFVLETATAARQRGASAYGQMLGWGCGADGYHVSAPDPSQRGAIAAIQQCLCHSQRSAQEVGYIHAHGTGTRLNDQNEASLIQRLFPATVPVSSTKGATGHTLGASGALGVAFGLLALDRQILPPCVGLQEAEFDLNLVRYASPAAIETALCFSFGFGGQNAVVALGRL